MKDVYFNVQTHNGNCEGVEIWVRMKPKYFRNIYKCAKCNNTATEASQPIENFGNETVWLSKKKYQCDCGGQRKKLFQTKIEDQWMMIIPEEYEQYQHRAETYSEYDSDETIFNDGIQ